MTNAAKTAAAKTVLLTVAMGTLAACTPEIGQGNSFFREAGSQIDYGDFGNTTLHNQLVQTCRTNGYGAGGKSGAASGDPIVVLDPSSTVSRPVFRVHCNGQLDGNYALTNYGAYIGSATEDASVSEADGG